MVHPSQEFLRKEKLLQNEVQYIAQEISDRFVVEPSIDEVDSDMLISIKRFKQGVRTKWIRVERKREGQEKNGASSEPETATDMSEGSTEMKEDEKEGLGTGLSNTGRGYDDSGCGSREVEGFLGEVENILISRIAELRKSDSTLLAKFLTDL